MIEFKAECGHTVRARDEDAGGAVRCSYCGRNAAVPDNVATDLDFLLGELEQSAKSNEALARRKRPRRQKLFRRRRPGSEAFDPFALVLKLCYGAALIIIVIVVARLWILPLFDKEGGPRRFALLQTDSPPRREQPAQEERRQRRGPGLIHGRRPTGLYVASTPPGGIAYCVEQSKAPPKGRIAHLPGVQQFHTNGECPHASEGLYVVEVAFVWNDTKLGDYEGYLAFRHAVEYASDERRRRLVEDYFLPDEASQAFVDKTGDRIYIVRQYRDVKAQHGRSEGVRALFLPKILQSDTESFSIEPLVTSRYIPNVKAYEFNESHVRNELIYYGVAASDRRFVIEALSRIGAIPYVTPDGRTRLFKIGIHDGLVTAPVIREATE